jgi:hypothetical protein
MIVGLIALQALMGPESAMIPAPSYVQFNSDRAISVCRFILKNRADQNLADEIVKLRVHPVGTQTISVIVRQNPALSGGFDARVDGKRVTIDVRDQSQLRFALDYLARMADSKVLFTGRFEARPKIQWRGVHLFVGPTALSFHKKLWTRVLLPMGFNKVVLQCEQTEWKCLPNVRGGIAMKVSDLAKLCDWYRTVGVEPIPLVQSLGHMDWLFKGKANLNLAMNSAIPYTIDSRKKETRRLFTRLWDEVIRVTKAKTIHVGLDEIALRGIPKDSALVTELWKYQVPVLVAIAKQHKVRLMLWSDECLAPGEAADTTNAASVEHSRLRRKIFPSGTLIGDWHYLRLTSVNDYRKSLSLFKSEKMQPIASMFYRPENIQTFTAAAIAENCGTLQTTWAGYESSEALMYKNLRQFNSMLLAADYAWGRKVKPSELPYEPLKTFLDLYEGRGRD